MVEIPRFSGTDEEKAKQIVDWVQAGLKNVSLSPKRALELGNRTPEEILQSGQVVTSFGCLDKAAIVSCLLKQNGFSVFFVLEQLLMDGKKYGVHFAVQAEKGDLKLTVDPHTTKINLLPGWFTSERRGQINMPQTGGTPVVFKLLKRVVVPENAMHCKVFKFAGIKGKMHYLWLSRANPIRLMHYVISRSNKKYTAATLRLERMQATRAKKPK